MSKVVCIAALRRGVGASQSVDRCGQIHGDVHRTGQSCVVAII